MKAAVYCGTSNLYQDMVVAAKSLASNSSVDIIYFLTESRLFPYMLPDYVKCIDVSNRTYFRWNGPNVYKRWTWMVLMRAALTKVFPDLDKILSLDVDTIVDENIDSLWDLDLLNYYLAAVPEPLKSTSDKPYVNNGVALYNLDKLRADKMDDEIIRRLNKLKYDFSEQDCINSLCYQNVLLLPSEYNFSQFTETCDKPRIYHFACDKKWNQSPLYDKYKNILWSEIRRNV